MQLTGHEGDVCSGHTLKIPSTAPGERGCKRQAGLVLPCWGPHCRLQRYRGSGCLCKAGSLVTSNRSLVHMPAHSTPPVLNPALCQGGDAKPSGRLRTRMGLSLPLCLLGGGQLPACSAATRSPQFSPNP